jgi:hypothetical protein
MLVANRKMVSFMCVAAAVTTTIVSTVVALTLNKPTNDETNEVKPLNRGHDYEHYNLSSCIDRKVLNNVLITYDPNTKQRIINKTHFRNNIEDIIRDTLMKISKFKNNADQYRIRINYQFTSDVRVGIDLV